MATTYERVPVMPTPSDEYENVIYKYAGSTNEKFIRGKYYKCTNVIDNKILNGSSVNNTFINNHESVMGYTVGGKGFSYAQVNGISAGTTGEVPIGGTLFIRTSSNQNGSVSVSLSMNWYEWQEVEIDEHDTVKYFSDENVAYLLSELTERIKQAHINE